MAQDIASAAADDSNPETGKHVLLALLIAAALVFGARFLSDHFVHPLATPATAVKLAPQAVVDPNAEDDRIAAEERQARQRREQALTEEDRARREQKKAEVMRARDAAVAASQAEETRKEAAWQRFYTRSKKCDAPADDALRVECSNQYIRARERFEKDFADGKLH
jgi:hypothetical protein